MRLFWDFPVGTEKTTKYFSHVYQHTKLGLHIMKENSAGEEGVMKITNEET